MSRISPNKIKHLKTGDVFNIQSNTDTAQLFTVVGADIIHHGSSKLTPKPTSKAPITVTLTTAYPFGRRICDTPLRYVVYAELTA